MDILNMTGHDIVLTCGILFKPAGKIRMKRKYQYRPIFSLDESISINLPEEKEDVYLIVSSIIYNLNPNRKDLLCPMTGVRGVKISKKSRKAQAVPGLFSRVELDIDKIIFNKLTVKEEA